MPLILRTRLAPAAAYATPPASGLAVHLSGAAAVRTTAGGLDIDPGLQPVEPNHYLETWFTPGTATPERHGPLQLVEHDDVLFAAWQGPGAGLRANTRRAYRELLAACRERGFEHPARIWNYFGDIHGEEDGLERYQAFCIGRAEALEELEIPLGSMPAATAIGTDHPDLFIYLIATRQPATAIENPRQVSAYHYPERYSPKSPGFARATRLDTADGPLLLISGTASIVGHESRHAGDVAAQTRETLANLQALHEAAGRDLPGPAWLRVYLRDARDRSVVAGILGEHYRDTHPSPVVQWARGDVCREELLVEIEGVHA